MAMFTSVHPTIGEADIEAPYAVADIEVAPLRPLEVRKASKTWSDAFVGDPLMAYTRDGEEEKRGPSKVSMALLLLGWMGPKTIYTVDSGSALVVATPVQNGPKPPAHQVIETIIRLWFKLLGKSGTAEQKKRRAEVGTKVTNVTKEKIGDRTKDMLYVDLLCTSPESQDHGYGGALLDTITRLADTNGQASWLVSSNILNEAFYNFHGFVAVGEAYLGEGNPEWHKDPIVVQVMVREPRSGEKALGR